MSVADAHWVSAIRRFGYVYPEKLKCPPLPSGCETFRCKILAHGIPDVKCRRRQAIWINSIRIPPRGHVQPCYPEQLHLNDSISYLDMLSGWKTLTIMSKPCYSPSFVALQWCVRTPCPDIFAMDS